MNRRAQGSLPTFRWSTLNLGKSTDPCPNPHGGCGILRFGMGPPAQTSSGVSYFLVVPFFLVRGCHLKFTPLPSPRLTWRLPPFRRLGSMYRGLRLLQTLPNLKVRSCRFRSGETEKVQNPPQTTPMSCHLFEAILFG